MANETGQGRTSLWRPAALLIFLIGMFVLFRETHLAAALTPSLLKSKLARLGWLEYPAGVLLFTALATVGAPGIVLSVANALLFGLWAGYVLNLIWATLGAICAFLIARYVARDAVSRHLPKRFSEMDRKLEEHGFPATLFFRLIPIIPYNIFNYAAGVTRVRFRDYLFGTVVGILPVTFAVVYATTSATNISLHDPRTWFTPQILAAAALFAVIVIVVPLIYRFWHRRRVPRE